MTGSPTRDKLYLECKRHTSGDLIPLNVNKLVTEAYFSTSDQLKLRTLNSTSEENTIRLQQNL